jgi:hypothetical protein
MRTLRRFTVAAVGVGLSLALASTAQAQFFVASGSGTYEITSPAPTSTASATLTLTVVSGPFDFASATGEVKTDSTVTPARVTGVMTLRDSAGDEIVINMLGESFGVGQTFESASGDWSMVSGTGVFAGLTGDGTWGYSVDFSAGFTGPQPMTAEIGGTLIPAPGSIALVSMVFGTLAARRRR